MEDKIKRILALALKLNPTETRQETTGNKPTVLVEFSGHVGIVYVSVYKNGWERHVDVSDEFQFYVDGTEMLLGESPDQCIEYLESLCRDQGIDPGAEPMEVELVG